MSVPSSGNPDGTLSALLNLLAKPSNTLTPAEDASIFQGLPILAELVNQGKLNEQQTKHVQQYLSRRSGSQAGPTQAATTATASATTTPTPTSNSALKRKSPGATDPPLTMNVSQTLTNSAPSTIDPGPQPWPKTSTPGRPTLTGGLPMGRMAGTPALLERVPEDLSLYGLGEVRVGPRKMTPADQSMRKSIQDLVSSIDPNVRVESEVEDLLLDIADEFIDSVTNFACRLAKHRGGDTLEVRDLQLHLERNHNIRIPGFSSDETRMSSAATGTAPAAKKATQGTHMTLRSARLAAIQQAKKDTKLI